MYINNVLACDRFYVIKETTLHTHDVKGGYEQRCLCPLGPLGGIESNIRISVRGLVLLDQRKSEVQTPAGLQLIEDC
jgi:hypothetical protein